LADPSNSLCDKFERGVSNKRYFLEETDLVPGMSADEATKFRQARLERRELES